MHSLTRPSHQRGMYLTGCPSPQGTVSSISCFKSLACGVPSPIKQPFRPFRVSLQYLMECPDPHGSGINLIVYSSSFLSVFSS